MALKLVRHCSILHKLIESLSNGDGNYKWQKGRILLVRKGNNHATCAAHISVHFLAVLVKTTIGNHQISSLLMTRQANNVNVITLEFK